MSRAEIVRELVKDPSLRVTDIAKQTGYNKGHVSRLRKEAKGQHMIENKLAKTPADGPVAWGCQCGRAYTVTCISSKPARREWVGLREDEILSILENLQTIYNRPPTEDSRIIFAQAIEAKLKEKNT